MRNPYEVLGVSRIASDQEIKQAYHNLVKKYHPDNYINNPLADLASEKMKEINEAYDTICRERPSRKKSRSAWGDYHAGGYQSNQSEQSTQSDSGPKRDSDFLYARIRNLININQLEAAEKLLIDVPKRDAEWYFLKGSVAYRRGWLDIARQNFQTACAMVPGNYEYQNALRSVEGGYNPYRQTAYRSSNSEACDLCEMLLCLNCLCGGCR